MASQTPELRMHLMLAVAQVAGVNTAHVFTEWSLLKLDNAFEAERAEQQQEQQQQHYERVMTKKVLEGLEDEMMPASSSTSELFGEVSAVI
eukprot:1158205-Pelagomonas_calceolata.AAC.3